MTRFRALAALTGLLTVTLAGAIAPAVHAATPTGTVTPSVGAAVGGYTTQVIITGQGLDGTTTVSISDCVNGSGQAVAGSGSISSPVYNASTGTVTVMLGPFEPSTCNVYTTTGGATAALAGTFTYSATTVAYITPVGIAPTIIPVNGPGVFMVSGSIINPSAPVGDANGFAGATGANLNCGTVTVPATVTPTGATSAPYPQAIITPNATALATVSAETACDVIITLASGNTVDTSAVVPQPGVWVDANVPTIGLSPAKGAASQVSNPSAGQNPQWVTATGTGLDKATGVQFAFCPSSNPIATYPVTLLKPAAGGGSISFPVPDVPPSSCAVIITLPASGARPAGYNVASVPPAGGFTFLPPYQGPITVTLSNPHTGNDVPSSGIHDSDLWVSALANPAGGGSISGFTGLNYKKLTSVQFENLPGYNPLTHTATLTFLPPLVSGNLYFSDSNLTGAPPNPLVSTARYGFTEFTYNDAGLDVDFTMIDQIGISMSQTLTNQNNTVIPGSYRDTGCLVDIVNDLSLAGVNMNPSTTASNPGVMRYNGTPPTTTPAAGQWTAADLSSTTGWVGLIGSSKLPVPYPSVQAYTSSVKGPLTITDNVGDPKYGGEFTYTATLSNGKWVLAGTVGGGAGGVGTQTGPTVTVEAAGLYGAGTKGGTGYGVYAQDGPFKVTLPSGKKITWSNGALLKGTGWTNVVKTIYRDFIAGYAYGYWGSAYGGGNNTGVNAVNFTMNPVTGAYNTAQPSYPTNGQYGWNAYDQIIRDHSNVDGTGNPNPSGVYAMPYSDTFVPSDLSPNQQQGFAYGWQLTLGDPTGCNPAATLAPAKQPVQVDEGTPIATATLSAANFPGPVTYTVTPALPDTLTLNPATGAITGTPTSPQTATVYTITGTSGSTTATATVTLAVGVDPTPVVEPNPTPTPLCLPPNILLPNGICASIA